jgi:RimJ/RimL family protein N-acetyltransferase
MPPRALGTARLDLIPATAELAYAAAYHPRRFSAALAARVPPEWPPELIEPDNLVFFATRLHEEPSLGGWSAWYVVVREPERKLIGLFGFNGRPDDTGTVTLGYALIDPAQGQGFGTEALQTLIDWAFSHPEVSTVAADTFLHLRASVRVLEKLGFVPGGEPTEPGAVRFQLPRSGSPDPGISRK